MGDEIGLISDQFHLAGQPLIQVAAQVLAANGVEGLVVGGAVRDVLLGRPVHDWDLAVERDALRLAREIANRLGAAYYTLDADRETGRVVVRHTDGTRTFLDLALRRGATWGADLEARDFTINAMGASLTVPGRLLDPLGGRADLAAGRVRAAGEGAFRGDPVRILRGVRLAASLGFALDPQTTAWARRDVPLLARVSAERMRDELARLLTIDGTAASLRQLETLSALAHVLPESVPMRATAQSWPHHWDVLEHTLILVDVLEQILALLRDGRAVGSLPVPPQIWEDLERALGPYRTDLVEHLATGLSDERTVRETLKLAAVLHDCGKPATLCLEADGRRRFFNHEQVGAELAAARLRALRFANVEIERVRTVIANHMRPHQLSDSGLTARGMYRYFRATGPAGVDGVLLVLADHLATYGPDLMPERWERRLETALALLQAYFDRLRAGLAAPALIDGNELINALGLRPGPGIGRLLDAIREAQATSQIHTAHEALELARNLLAQDQDGKIDRP